MQKQLQQLIEWHTEFQVPFHKNPPLNLDARLVCLRANIMEEEVREWRDVAFRFSMTKANIPVRAKELADILYTVFGTIITEGLQDQIEAVFDAVHKSNMSKLGPDGKPIKRADGKVLKGPNYKEPDLSFLVY